MKILFISSKNVNLKRNGGELCTNRNYLSFCELVGKENVVLYNVMEGIKFNLSNTVRKRFNFLYGFNEGLSLQKIKEIITISKNVDVVFIDSSIEGCVAYHLKKQGYKGKIITHFHNVEYKIKLEKAKIKPWKILEAFITLSNEKKACRYSNIIVTVNKRDKIKLERTYKPENITTIPISLIDNYKASGKSQTSSPPTLIFTGNNWYPNIHGLSWFIDNVLDHVDIKLQITGARMERLKNKYNHPKIEFLGFVNDLATVLKEADFTVLPVFLGSGMKVKTCEALMYGKHIIATTESLEGYELEPNKIGALCNTKEEFIEAIKRLCYKKQDKFNDYSRKYYVEKYSFESTLNSFKALLN